MQLDRVTIQTGTRGVCFTYSDCGKKQYVAHILIVGIEDPKQMQTDKLNRNQCGFFMPDAMQGNSQLSTNRQQHP